MIVFPHAKINIGLYVTGRRDDGYHNLETLFYPIGFADILEVVPDFEAEAGSIRMTLSGLAVEGRQEENLIVRACRLIQGYQTLPGIKMHLHKKIPTGAGLGGGSSDGANMLSVLNKLFDLNIPAAELFELALQLGSDCPFFLHASPSIARGRGEKLEKSGINLKGYTILLFHPGTGISTAAAYQYVKAGEPLFPLEQLVSQPVPDWKNVVQNVFEPYAFAQLPVIEKIKEELYACGALYASMTGSGSAIFGIFDQEPDIPEGISGYLIWKEVL